LADKEEEVFSIKDTLFSLRKELTDLKQKNLHLKNSNKKLTNMSLISQKVSKNLSLSLTPQKTSLILKPARKRTAENRGISSEFGQKKGEEEIGGKSLEMIDEREEIGKETGELSSHEVLIFLKEYFIRICFGRFCLIV
jgi:hypothetical protein